MIDHSIFKLCHVQLFAVPFPKRLSLTTMQKTKLLEFFSVTPRPSKVQESELLTSLLTLGPITTAQLHTWFFNHRASSRRTTTIIFPATCACLRDTTSWHPTALQLSKLVAYFNEFPSPSVEQRHLLLTELISLGPITSQQLSRWFANRRANTRKMGIIK